MTTRDEQCGIRAGLLAMDRLAVLLSRIASLGEAVMRAVAPDAKARILRRVRSVAEELAGLCIAEAERLEGATREQ